MLVYGGLIGLQRRTYHRPPWKGTLCGRRNMLGNYEAALLLITLAREAVAEVHSHFVVCAPVLSEVGEGPEHDIRAAARRSPDEVSPLRVASAELGQAPHEPPREANRHALVPHCDHEHQVRSHCRRGVPGLTDWRVRQGHLQAPAETPYPAMCIPSPSGVPPRAKCLSREPKKGFPGLFWGTRRINGFFWI